MNSDNMAEAWKLKARVQLDFATDMANSITDRYGAALQAFGHLQQCVDAMEQEDASMETVQLAERVTFRFPADSPHADKMRAFASSGPDFTPPLPLLHTVAQGLLEIAKLAMPGTFFQSDSRVQLARAVLDLPVPGTQLDHYAAAIASTSSADVKLVSDMTESVMEAIISFYANNFVKPCNCDVAERPDNDLIAAMAEVIVSRLQVATLRHVVSNPRMSGVAE